MWAIARLRHPIMDLIVIDTVGRVAFSAWMVVALASGASALLGVFLVLELAWAVLQGAGLVAQWRGRRMSSSRTATAPA
ncbi:MAG TPA: hypothetical protein VFR16_12360 [Agromyces mariniharenae]|nr:hypothetical protein [Agromyces mariniharenae]